jgi:hypothetical protein
MALENIANADIESYIHVGSVLVNVLIAYMMTRMKLEVSEIKVWILENFERRGEKRD